MRISDWSSDVCSSDLQWRVNRVVRRISRRRDRNHGQLVARLDQMDAGPCGKAGARRWGAHSRRQSRLPGDRGRTRTLCEDAVAPRSEEHTSELQSLMRISYAVFCLKQQINM